MSKSKKPKQDTTPYKNYSNYLKSVDTSNVDNTLGNLTNYAQNASQNLANSEWYLPTVSEGDYYRPQVNQSDWYMPEVNKEDWYRPEINRDDWRFDVDASDEARQRAEQATYQSYMDKLTPQFQQQTADLQNDLINKGLSIGSEAYERAMTDLQNNQNNALNQAAYQSVLNGQNAYSQSLNDEIAAGNFGNNAQTAYTNAMLAANSANSDYINAQLAANSANNDYINAQLAANGVNSDILNAKLAANSAQQGYLQQIFNAMNGSPSEYENQQNIFSVDAGKAAVDYQNALARAKSGWSGAITGALQGGIAGAMTGNPYAAAAMAGAGAYSGYNSNPYAGGGTGLGDWSSLLSSAAKYKNAGSK